MSLSSQYIDSLVKTIRYQSNASMSVDGAKEYLTRNPDEVLRFTNLSHKKRSDFDEFYDAETTSRPIRRCDVEPLEHDQTDLLEKFKICRGWTEAEQHSLMLLWKLYLRDRESFLHEFVHLWNSQRQKFVQFNRYIPFLKGTLGVMDHKLHYRVQQMDRLFQLTLTVLIMQALDHPLPANWEKTQYRAFNGFKTKDTDVDEYTISSVLGKLLFQKGPESRISKVEKKRAMLEIGMDLSEMNDYIQSRIHLFSEFAFISPSLPAVSLLNENAGLMIQDFEVLTELDVPTNEHNANDDGLMLEDFLDMKHFPSDWIEN
jgi:hypothetical protein